MTAIDVLPVGNLGNQMLQWMLLEGIASRTAEAEFFGFDIPLWNLQRPRPKVTDRPAIRLVGQYVDVPAFERLLRSSRVSRVEFAALGFRMENYRAPSHYHGLFPAEAETPNSLPADRLLINVRGAEILGNVHADYGPMPLSFYRQIIRQTKLMPVFMGQLSSDSYSQSLRAEFPEAEFIESLGPKSDFQLIRSAKHVVVSVSTFSWLAAWLSSAVTIHMPVFGIFNPVQRPDIDLLPVSDERYRFYRFPVRRWAGTEAQFADLCSIAEFPEMRRGEVELILQSARDAIQLRSSRYRARLWAASWLNRLFDSGMRVKW
jgi:hypothetical protein